MNAICPCWYCGHNQGDHGPMNEPGCGVGCSCEVEWCSDCWEPLILGICTSCAKRWHEDEGDDEYDDEPDELGESWDEDDGFLDSWDGDSWDVA